MRQNWPRAHRKNPGLWPRLRRQAGNITAGKDCRMAAALQCWADGDEAAIISGKTRPGDQRPGRNGRNEETGIKFMAAVIGEGE